MAEIHTNLCKNKNRFNDQETEANMYTVYNGH